jgi:hypothetical protein
MRNAIRRKGGQYESNILTISSTDRRRHYSAINVSASVHFANWLTALLVLAVTTIRIIGMISNVGNPTTEMMPSKVTIG